MSTKHPPIASRDTCRARLLAELRAHVPADEVEAAHRERMLALAVAPGDGFSRHHFAPGHFTASAFVLAPDEAALLLIFHQRLGRWLQPGGHIELADADPVAAARREVAEETGVVELDALGPGPGQRLLLDLDIHPIPGHGPEPPHEHFDVRVFFRARDTKLSAGPGVAAARWVPLSLLQVETGDRSVERAVAKLGARHTEKGGRL